jgi:hypothetical protein
MAKIISATTKRERKGKGRRDRSIRPSAKHQTSTLEGRKGNRNRDTGNEKKILTMKYQQRTPRKRERRARGRKRRKKMMIIIL